MKYLHLTKVVIHNFRSIEHLELKNIGDITILIGPNESGKSNILQALNWFGNSKPLDADDIPVDKKGLVRDNDVIIELYLKVLNVPYFLKILKSKISKRLKGMFGIDFVIDLTNLQRETEIEKAILSNTKIKEASCLYLKFQKMANSSFSCYLLDDKFERFDLSIAKYLQKEVLENLKKIDLPSIFNQSLDEQLENLLLANNVPKNQIQAGINQIKNHPNISSSLSLVKQKLQSFKVTTSQELISELDSQISPTLKAVSASDITFSISGRNIVFSPHSLLMQVFERMKEKIKGLMEINFEQVVENSLLELKPDFVYLVEEMELEGTVRKDRSWSNTLREDRKEHVINFRLFSVMGVDIEKFDKMSIEDQSLELRNKLNNFSGKLMKIWKQQRIRIIPNITPTEINLHIEEIDENNNPIKTTKPKVRSRGAKWYLAYFITLEYLKKKENTILLLDDPAVFLHERGQKDFLRTLEEVSKNVQVFYNTHLVSLFDERELDRVRLVELDKNHRTIIKKPWTNKIEEVAAPVYHALGIDKLIFEKTQKILFVEGISDKFYLEGLQAVNKLSKEWYIHPISGGSKLENNDLVNRIEMVSCLSKHKEIDYYFVLDGDRKNIVQDTNLDMNKVILLGNESQELEDLFGKDFYLNSVLECYRDIFVDNNKKLRKLEKIVKEIWKNSASTTSKITKRINDEFKNAGIGKFSKVDVAIHIKRKLKRGEFKDKDVSDLVRKLRSGLKDSSTN